MTTIVKNSFFNLISYIINFVVLLLLVPLMLLHLGEVGFGVWALVRVFVSYASLGEMGLSFTVTKYVAQYYAAKRLDEIVKTIYSAFFIYCIISILTLGAVELFQQFIITYFFLTSENYLGDIPFVLLGSMFIFSVNITFSVFSSALNGIEKIQHTNIAMSIYSVLNGVMMYWAILLGYGLRGIIYSNAIATIILVILNGLLFFRLFPDISISSFLYVKFNKSKIISLLHYSKNMFVNAIASLFTINYDKLLLGNMTNMNIVANYEIASRVVQQIRQILILMLNPMLPASSKMEADNGIAVIKEFYLRSIKYVILISVPLMGILGILAQEWTMLWLHQENPLVINTIYILTVSNFINILTGPGYFITLGIGKPQLVMYSGLAGLGIILIANITLFLIFGYYGAVCGTALSLSLGSILFIGMFHRTIKVSSRVILNLLVKPLIGLIIAALLALFLRTILIDAIFKIIVLFVAMLSVYILFVVKSKYVNDQDYIFFSQLIKGFRNKVFGTA